MQIASVMNALRAMLAAGIPVNPGAVAAVTMGRQMESTTRYPEWVSKRKTRGRKDASLRERSSRRKASR